MDGALRPFFYQSAPMTELCLLKFKVKAISSFMARAMSELQGVTKVRCHTILLAARHKRAHSALTPASEAGTRFTYPGGTEG